MKLSDLIRQPRFATPAQEAMLSVIATSSWLNGRLGATMSNFDITPAQYNVLRILRGSHPEKLTCSAIGERLLDRTPDVTRLLNRLQKAGYIDRARAEQDRRVVEVGITPAGLKLLGRMDDPVADLQDEITEGLSDAELRQLIDLLERLREAEPVA